ncbi:hypothetical protein Psed_6590 [Pseudonocardia dioxanivorans CB1190]|uniref:Uncharacterized protein n=2 Tax=Pseudonocardiaceae TaxID=2070 RepID=F4CWI6_PSEUX|nr:hypothetical protein Psed_6590 [Pseudonocardia dioxanivorans CB1190]GJF05591.1 hypothetical protein PSD17_45420 [Pseudonocardia sp. D17]
MARMSALVLVMESLAILFATWMFGWPVLVVGVPALIATALLLVTAHAADRRRIRREREAAAIPTLPGGLMSGFFRLPAQPVPHEVRDHSRA